MNKQVKRWCYYDTIQKVIEEWTILFSYAVYCSRGPGATDYGYGYRCANGKDNAWRKYFDKKYIQWYGYQQQGAIQFKRTLFARYIGIFVHWLSEKSGSD
jgi:hypothetical protein